MLIKISLKCVPKCPINNIPALVQIMAWCQPGANPLCPWLVYSRICASHGLNKLTDRPKIWVLNQYEWYITLFIQFSFFRIWSNSSKILILGTQNGRVMRCHCSKFNSSLFPLLQCCIQYHVKLVLDHALIRFGLVFTAIKETRLQPMYRNHGNSRLTKTWSLF